MTVPMVILAVLSVIGGLYGTPVNNAIANVLSPVLGSSSELLPSQSMYWFSILASLVAALAGIGMAWQRYGKRSPSFAGRGNPLIRLLEHRYYIDDLYQQILVRPVLALGRMFRRGFEGTLLWCDEDDRFGRHGNESWVTRVQSGYVRSYAFTMLLGVIVILVFVLLHF